MYFEFSGAEKKEIKALESSYQKLLEEAEKRADALRADDPEPDPKRLAEIEKKIKTILKRRPKEPDNAVSYADLETYYASKVYKEWEALYKPLTEERDRIVDEWYSGGSAEWFAAREEYFKLEKELQESRDALFDKARRRYFDSLGTEPEKIYSDACRQIRELVERPYLSYEDQRYKSEWFSAYDIRVQNDGNFTLDTDETRKRIVEDLTLYFDALKAAEGYTVRLNDYLNKILKTSPYVSSEGVLRGRVKGKKKPQKNDDVLAKRPTDYVTSVDRITKKTFANALIKPLDEPEEALYNVRLDSRGKVLARVAIDYKDLLSKGTIISLPELTAKDYSVHDAIITLLAAGNRVMSYDMIYRVMIGKPTGKVEVPDAAKKDIDDALTKFKGRFIMEYEHKDESGNIVSYDYNEPLVTFRQGRRRINGQIVEGAIEIPDDHKFDPPLLRWAQSNGNEIDTRDITLLDVPKLNNGDESFAIKMCLYRRIINMSNYFERVKKGRSELEENERTIRYDYVYKELGLEDPDRRKRTLLKDKIDRCLQYWKERGLITDYEHKKESNTYYAVVLSFMPKK